MGVVQVAGVIGKLEGTAIAVQQERCVLVRNRNARCLRCAEACVSGCISVDGNNLVIDPEKCIGCTTCATMCPTGALEPKNPRDLEMLELCLKAAHLTGGLVTIICDRMREKVKDLVDLDKVVVVPCIGRVEESLIMCLAASDDVKRMDIVTSLCEGCEYKLGCDTANTVAQTAQVLLDTWHEGLDLRVSPKMSGAIRKQKDLGYDQNKRGFFAAMGQEAKQAAKIATVSSVGDALGVEQQLVPQEGPVYVKVDAKGVLPQFVPGRRHRLLAALEKMGEPDDIMFDTRLWGHVLIDTDLCNSCRMCTVFCPTGALSLYAEKGSETMTIGHFPGSCVKCRCCESICPKHAISISEEVFAVDMTAGLVDTYDLKVDARIGNASHGMFETMKGQFGTKYVSEF